MRVSHTYCSSIALLAVLATSSALLAQQDPLYSQYMFNTLPFNPGYAGSADVMTAMALSRHQWVGFDGAPATQTLSLHSPLRNKSIALGMNLINDKNGPISQTGAYLNIAYRMRTGASTQLAFGLMGGGNMYQAELAKLETVDPDPHNTDLQGQFMPNVGFGIYLHGEKAYAGISAPKLLQNEFDPEGGGDLITKAEEERHYFLIMGIVRDINADVKFKPSIMVRVVEGAPISADLNASILLREKIWFGVLYRLGNSFGFNALYQFNEQLRAGYAFDMTSRIIGRSLGTHEIMLSYDFRFTKGRTISPRYF